MGRQKRNASRIQAFHAFSPHGHAMPCWIRALQLWLSASALPHAKLWPSTVLPARGKKMLPKVTEGASSEALSGTLTHPLISALCMCPGGFEFPRVRKKRGVSNGVARPAGHAQGCHIPFTVPGSLPLCRAW